MPIITLPDGSQRTFASPVSVYDVAAEIGPGLAKAALAGKVDGKLVDTSHVINADAQLSIITEKSDEGLEVIRHSAAHLLAQAVKALYPAAQITIGRLSSMVFITISIAKPGLRLRCWPLLKPKWKNWRRLISR